MTAAQFPPGAIAFDADEVVAELGNQVARLAVENAKLRSAITHLQRGAGDQPVMEAPDA